MNASNSKWHLLWVLTLCDCLSVMSRCNSKSWGITNFRLSLCHMNMHTLTRHMLASPIKYNCTCCYREADGEGSCNNTSVPWNCLLPVVPHSCLKRHWHICSDKAAVHGSTFWQRPFSTQHSHLFEWVLRGVNGPVSRQCHDESVYTFRPRCYAGH